MTDLREAVREADAALSASRANIDRALDDMARLVLTRIRQVDRHNLKDLKRAIRRFDASKKRWKP